jgi:hypothetical protein
MSKLTREQVEVIRGLIVERNVDGVFDEGLALCDTTLAAMDERDHLQRIVDETPTMMAMEQAELVPGLQRENRELREALDRIQEARTIIDYAFGALARAQIAERDDE